MSSQWNQETSMTIAVHQTQSHYFVHLFQRHQQV